MVRIGNFQELQGQQKRRVSKYMCEKCLHGLGDHDVFGSCQKCACLIEGVAA